MWSNMMRTSWRRGRDPILEDLAVTVRGLPEAPRRHPGGASEGANEVRQIGEADVEGDLADRAISVGEEPGGAAQPGPDQVLVRGHADHPREQAKEVKRA